MPARVCEQTGQACAVHRAGRQAVVLVLSEPGSRGLHATGAAVTLPDPAPGAYPGAGLLARMSVGAVSARLTTSFAWYNSSDGLDSEENRGQASGAYIFRCGIPPGGVGGWGGGARGGGARALCWPGRVEA